MSTGDLSKGTAEEFVLLLICRFVLLVLLCIISLYYFEIMQSNTSNTSNTNVQRNSNKNSSTVAFVKSPVDSKFISSSAKKLNHH